MKKVWEFALTAKQAAAIATCLALSILLFAMAGFAAGLIVAENRTPLIANARPELPKTALPAIASVKEPAAPLAKEEPKAPAEPAAPASLTAPPASPSATTTAPALSASSATAPPVEAQAASSEKPAAHGSASVAKPAASPIQIAVQIGSFRQEDNARNVLDRLKQFGYPATTYSMTDARNGQWHVVQVGPYADYDDASRVALELSGRYHIEPRLVPQAAF